MAEKKSASERDTPETDDSQRHRVRQLPNKGQPPYFQIPTHPTVDIMAQNWREFLPVQLAHSKSAKKSKSSEINDDSMDSPSISPLEGYQSRRLQKKSPGAPAASRGALNEELRQNLHNFISKTCPKANPSTISSVIEQLLLVTTEDELFKILTQLLRDGLQLSIDDFTTKCTMIINQYRKPSYNKPAITSPQMPGALAATSTELEDLLPSLSLSGRRLAANDWPTKPEAPTAMSPPGPAPNPHPSLFPSSSYAPFPAPSSYAPLSTGFSSEPHAGPSTAPYSFPSVSYAPYAADSNATYARTRLQLAGIKSNPPGAAPGPHFQSSDKPTNQYAPSSPPQLSVAEKRRYLIRLSNNAPRSPHSKAAGRQSEPSEFTTTMFASPENTPMRILKSFVRNHITYTFLVFQSWSNASLTHPPDVSHLLLPEEKQVPIGSFYRHFNAAKGEKPVELNGQAWQWVRVRPDVMGWKDISPSFALDDGSVPHPDFDDKVLHLQKFLPGYVARQHSRSMQSKRESLLDSTGTLASIGWQISQNGEHLEDLSQQMSGARQI